MSESFEEAVKFVLNSGLDYGSLTKTDEFKMVNTRQICSFMGAFSRLEIALIGDLYEINMSGRGAMKLLVLYRVEHQECYYAYVSVKSPELKKRIREEAKTMKGIVLKVRCIESETDTFELTDIESLDNPCNFGRFICTDCGHDYGFDAHEACDICESPVEQVFDFYKKQ